MVIYVITCIVGNTLAFGLITPIFTYFFYNGDFEITLMQTLIGGTANCAVLIIIGLPVLIALAKRNARGTNLTEQ